MPPFYKSFQSNNTREKKQPSHYNVLEITKTANLDEIKSARKRLTKANHPDKNPGNENAAHVKQQQINEAYRVLSDPSLRRDYDISLQPSKISASGDFFANRNPSSSDVEEDFDEPLYKFTDPRNGQETFFTKGEIEVIYHMRQVYERQKYGEKAASKMSSSFEQFFDMFERQETKREKYWKRVLLIAVGLFLAVLLLPFVYGLLTSPSFWYLPTNFVTLVYNVLKGVATFCAVIGLSIVVGACFWWLALRLFIIYSYNSSHPT